MSILTADKVALTYLDHLGLRVNGHSENFYIGRDNCFGKVFNFLTLKAFRGEIFESI